MNRLLDSLRRKLASQETDLHLQPRSLFSLQQELTRLVSLEMKHDLEEEVMDEKPGFNRNVAEAISKINESVIISFIQNLDEDTLLAVLEASRNPVYKPSKMLMGKTGDNLDENAALDVRDTALFFTLLNDAGIKVDNFQGAFYHLGVLTGITDMSVLRKEPEEYLRALITIFTTMPMDRSTSGVIDPGVRQLLKGDSSIVSTLIDFASDRGIDLKDITPTSLKEVLATPAKSLRGGAL